MMQEVQANHTGSRRRFGPQLEAEGVRFRLWAPSVEAVDLLLLDRPNIRMDAVGEGWFERWVEGLRPGPLYRFAAGGAVFPDPASRSQAGDVNGWSVVAAPFPPCSPRSHRPWHEAILAELHVGSASPEGTFRGLAQRLGHFANAGYTAIELMPIAAFPGASNWGYDGVLPFSPEESYGSPQDLRTLVDEAHRLGLAILVDVVYNHFGPVGNALPVYAKEFFAGEEMTPWGAAIDLANPTVRAFFRENVAMWLEDYDFDGIRFDAMHEYRTDGAAQFKRELAATARAIKADALLVMENFDYEQDLVLRDEDGRPLHFDAMWNVDVHHALHVLATEDDRGYFRAFAAAPAARARDALAAPIGAKEAAPEPPLLPPEAFVSYIQNHDEVGNLPHGERLASELDAGRLDFLHFVVMLSPQIPMFLMGEEMHVRQPFPFFGDLGGELTDVVREGRIRQLADFLEVDVAEVKTPDPSSEDTAAMSKLDWSEVEQPERMRALERFRTLAGFRRDFVWPLTAGRYWGSEAVENDRCMALRWRYDGGTLVVALNASPEAGQLEVELGEVFASTGDVWQEAETARFGAWSAVAWIDSAN